MIAATDAVRVGEPIEAIDRHMDQLSVDPEANGLKLNRGVHRNLLLDRALLLII
jgi:hypothetical protein